MRAFRPPVSPLRIDDCGWVQFLPSGRCLICLDPLPKDAPARICEEQRRYVATLDLAGHRIIVGTWHDMVQAVAEEQYHDD